MINYKEDARAKCFEAMKHRLRADYPQTDGLCVSARPIFLLDVELTAIVTSAFDALHGIARVCPVEATEEMHIAVKKKRATDQALFRPSPWGEMFKVMVAAGDLTNGGKTQYG